MSAACGHADRAKNIEACHSRYAIPVSYGNTRQQRCSTALEQFTPHYQGGCGICIPTAQPQREVMMSASMTALSSRADLTVAEALAEKPAMLLFDRSRSRGAQCSISAVSNGAPKKRYQALYDRRGGSCRLFCDPDSAGDRAENRQSEISVGCHQTWLNLSCIKR